MRLVTPVVAVTARRVSLVWGDASAHVISEIVQEVFLKLVEDERRILRSFEDRGNDAFLKLLRVVAASVATDYHRRAQADKRGGRKNTMPLDVAGGRQTLLNAQGTHAVEWPALMGQLDGLLRTHAESISERDRQIFWLYYRQGLSAQAIAGIPAMELTPKGVESALRRMTQLLRETLARGRQVGTPGEETIRPVVKELSTFAAINQLKRQQ